MPDIQPPRSNRPDAAPRPPNSEQSRRGQADQEKTQLAVQWLSRTMSIMLFMVGPALLGSYLDRRLGTKFLTVSGLVLGMALATGLLLLLVKALTPPAGGKPIPFEDEPNDEENADGH